MSSKGSLTGGYFNTSRSRLEMQKARSEYMESIKATEKELIDIQRDLKKTEDEINRIVFDMQKTETRQSNSKLVSSIVAFKLMIDMFKID